MLSLAVGKDKIEFNISQAIDFFHDKNVCYRLHDMKKEEENMSNERPPDRSSNKKGSRVELDEKKGKYIIPTRARDERRPDKEVNFGGGEHTPLKEKAPS